MLTQKRLLMDEEVEGIVHMRSPNMVPSWQPQSSTVHKQQRFYVVRAFVQFRQTLESHNDFAHALAILEARLEVLMHRQGTFEGQTELQMAQIFEVLRKLASTPESKPSRPIGFIYPDS